jgi:hypothetical protein
VKPTHHRFISRPRRNGFRISVDDLFSRTSRSRVVRSTTNASFKPVRGYEPFYFDCSLSSREVEISEDTFIVTREAAATFHEVVEAAAACKPMPYHATVANASAWGCFCNRRGVWRSAPGPQTERFLYEAYLERTPSSRPGLRVVNDENWPDF